MIKKRIDKLRSKFIKYGIDGYVVPKMMNFSLNTLIKTDLNLYQILQDLQDVQ